MKESTTFVIAHKLTTAWDADIIVVLSEGEIVETDKHDELFKLKATYYKLYPTYRTEE